MLWITRWSCCFVVMVSVDQSETWGWGRLVWDVIEVRKVWCQRFAQPFFFSHPTLLSFTENTGKTTLCRAYMTYDRRKDRPSPNLLSGESEGTTLATMTYTQNDGRRMTLKLHDLAGAEVRKLLPGLTCVGVPRNTLFLLNRQVCLCSCLQHTRTIWCKWVCAVGVAAQSLVTTGYK